MSKEMELTIELILQMNVSVTEKFWLSRYFKSKSNLFTCLLLKTIYFFLFVGEKCSLLINNIKNLCCLLAYMWIELKNYC